MNYDLEIERRYHPENFESANETDHTEEELEMMAQEMQEYNPE